MFASRVPPWAAVVAVAASVVITGALLLALPAAALNGQASVAFIGSSYLFLNDVPRLMEAVSMNKIRQDSCIHPMGNLASIVETGSGVYGRWHSKNALLRGSNSSLYDLGSCTITQLLNGSDADLTYGNSNGAYYNDGYNPCFQDSKYWAYLKHQEGNKKWDYVVLADLTKRMAFQETRNETLAALKEHYIPLFKKTGARPIVVDTHAFWSSYTNMTGLTDVTTFAAMIHEGAHQYLALLREHLPSEKRPILAKIGIAYLTVYEESYEMWEKLFYKDSVHASLHGSFLFACVLHCAIYGNVPSKGIVANVEGLFARARKLQETDYPTTLEAEYLWKVADKVMTKGYVPKFDFTATSSTKDSDYDI